jgi:hypothetical protein
MGFSDATEKFPSDTTGIDPGTFRLVAQWLNQYVTPGPTMRLLKRFSQLSLNETKVCYQINYIPLSFIAGNEASVDKNGIKHNTVQKNK